MKHHMWIHATYPEMPVMCRIQRRIRTVTVGVGRSRDSIPLQSLYGCTLACPYFGYEGLLNFTVPIITAPCICFLQTRKDADLKHALAEQLCRWSSHLRLVRIQGLRLFRIEASGV